MLAALAVVIPLGLGGAISPVMLTEQTVLFHYPLIVRWAQHWGFSAFQAPNPATGLS